MKKWQKGLVMLCLLFLLAAGLQYGTAGLYGLDDQAADGLITERMRDVIALHVDSPLALVNNREVRLDKDSEFVTPLLVANRVMVPVRFIAENLSGQVHWDEKNQTVTIAAGGKRVYLTLNKPEIQVDNEKKTLEAPPAIYMNRTYVPLRAVSEAFDRQVDYQGGLVTIAPADADLAKLQERELVEQVRGRINRLPVVGTEENFRRLLAEAGNQAVYTLRGANSLMKQAESVVQAPAADTGSVRYSTTNVQVQGVDEADLVKTDGKYIYQVSGEKVIISQAYPAQSMKVVAVLNPEDTGLSPQELYVDENYLVVIGSTRTNMVWPMDLAVSAKRIMPPYYYAPKVKALIYNIKDKENITKVRELELDGSLISSRKIGNALYLVANQYVYYYPAQGTEPIPLPTYRDTAVKDEASQIPLTEIRCFPPVLHPNYLLVAALDLSKPKEAAEISAYLGSGENIYVSEEHLYVAVTQYQGHYPGRPGILEKAAAETEQEKTVIFKFALKPGQVTYLQKGEVPGRILNQFSMDEYAGNFRIATTTGYSWSSGEQTSRNNLYVLDKSLSIIGRLEGIAPGEQIYSTRFMGERAYMVTFKTVDPLFVLDLQNPQNPKILGALKIPGYSDYLHPYDANHFIGFGKDTVEVTHKDSKGKVVGTTAYYLGMKIALFDVTDVANPKELYSEKIGDRGTHSDLLYNHKALLFDKEKNLLAFPVTVMEVAGGGEKLEPRTGMPEYGQFAFQGAYVYKLDLSKGFTLQGRITHLTPEDYRKAGTYGAEPSKEVKRILTIGDTLYTLSDSRLQANQLTDLKEINNLMLP